MVKETGLTLVGLMIISKTARIRLSKDADGDGIDEDARGKPLVYTDSYVTRGLANKKSRNSFAGRAIWSQACACLWVCCQRRRVRG